MRDLPKTRADAIAQGAEFYFTGKPCKNGHIVPRHTSGNCPECLKGAHVRRQIDYRTWMFNAKKANAKKRGIEFTITLDDLVIPDICPVLGIKLNRSPDSKHAGNAPTIDRIDPSKGYAAGNIAVISHRANRKKQDCTIQELRKILDYMEANQ